MILPWAVRSIFVFFFNDTATTEIYTLSLHDALPIWLEVRADRGDHSVHCFSRLHQQDRKSTRLNSSHRTISYAVFCLKKKNIKQYSIYMKKKKYKKKIKKKSNN